MAAGRGAPRPRLIPPFTRAYFQPHMKTALIVALGLASSVASAQVWQERVLIDRVEAAGERFRVVQVIDRLENPWGLAFLPDGRMLIGERPGRLLLAAGGRTAPVGGGPEVAAIRQGGLLDLAVHPDFRRNRLVYLAYSSREAGGLGTRIARARLEGERLEGLEVIFSMARGSSASHHFGSRMAFAPDGTLLFTIGDRGEMNRAQELGDHAGKTLRIRDDGSIPQDNPFIGRPGALAEIYSYGHRNSQGMVFQPGTGLLWQHEHGPRGGDEVNIIEAGRNYGWPAITYGIDYNGAVISSETARPGMEQPVVYWVPSIAPSGMTFYTGDRFPSWKGDLFVGALAGQQLRRLEVSGARVTDQEVLLEGKVGRIRTVVEGPDGYLWLLTDAARGALLRLEPVPR